MSKKMKVILGVVLAVVLVGALIFAFVLGKDKGKDEAVGSPVSFTVNAEGWSEETSSPIPIQVTGETEDKEKVDEKYFLGASDKDLVLKPGAYEVEVYASPVNADGGMYRCPNAVKLSVPKATGKPQSKPSASESADSEAVASVEFELSPIPANEITDEDIEKAQAAMKDAGLDEAKIKTFTDSVRKARQTELDRIEADRKAEEERKEAERKAEEMRTKVSALVGSYFGFSGSDGSGNLYVSADGSAVYEFHEEGVERSHQLTFTSITPVDRGYKVTFAEDFMWAYSNGSYDSYQPAGSSFLVCPEQMSMQFIPTSLMDTCP